MNKEFVGWILKSIFLHLEKVTFLLRVILCYHGLSRPFRGPFTEKQRQHNNHHDNQCTTAKTNNCGEYSTWFQRNVPVVCVLVFRLVIVRACWFPTILNCSRDFSRGFSRVNGSCLSNRLVCPLKWKIK